MSNPFNQLASILENRTAQQTNRAITGLSCALGTMTSTGVKLDDFKHEMQDPLFAANLKLDLKPGDRVLCVPVNGGIDVVIVCKVEN